MQLEAKVDKQIEVKVRNLKVGQGIKKVVKQGNSNGTRGYVGP